MNEVNQIIDQAITTKEVIGKISTSDSVWHVAFSGTKNYLVHTGIAMTSFLMSNPKNAVAFHLFINGISLEDKEKMQSLAAQWNCQISLYYVNDRLFQDMLHRDGIAAFFYRFLIPPVLAKEKVKRVLYLDGDIMCQNSAAELMNVELGNNVAACVQDKSPENAEMRRQKIGTRQYFNSGMILIDVAKWNQNRISEKSVVMAIERKKSGKPLASHDQDILNILLDGKFYMASQYYNYNYNVSRKGFFQKETRLIYDKNAVFVHFSGVVKPWRSWVQDLPGVIKYRSFAEASPWKDVPLVGFQRHKDIHQAARHARHMGKYGKMCRLYVQYFAAKLTHQK